MLADYCCLIIVEPTVGCRHYKVLITGIRFQKEGEVSIWNHISEYIFRKEFLFHDIIDLPAMASLDFTIWLMRF